jgi:hypothetical protein
MSPQTDFDPRLLAALEGFSEDALKGIITDVEQYEKKLREEGPTNDDELWWWIKKELGITLPRKAIVEGNDPPFQFVADLYFQRVGSVLLLAPRGGGKTLGAAIVHYLDCLFKPGYEGLTFGADLAQAAKGYEHLRRWLLTDTGDKKDFLDGDPTALRTNFRNGSKVSIVPGSKKAVNGPHPNRAHADEVELMDDDVYRESRHMPVSGVDKNGNPLPAQHVLTSTRKGPRGRMQELMDEIEHAKRNNLVPPMTLYRYSVWEVAERVPNCQEGLGINPLSCECEGKSQTCPHHCNCHMIQSGYWDKEAANPRFLKDVCQGKLLRAEGWRAKSDVDTTFQQSTRDDWEAQQECKKPATHLLYVPWWSEELHTLREYQPKPENGPIYQGLDWGGTNPHAVIWTQLLTEDSPAVDHFGKVAWLKKGTLVTFDEIYKTGLSDSQLADLVHAKEEYYRSLYGPRWQVVPGGRFPDPANPSGRVEFAQHNPPLVTTYKATREFLQHTRYIKGLFEEDRYRVAKRCEDHIREISSWSRNEKKPIDPKTGEHPELEEANHSCAAFRYLLANLHVIERRRMLRGAASGSPAAASGSKPGDTGPQPDVPVNPVKIIQRRENQMSTWRKSFGAPVTVRR